MRRRRKTLPAEQPAFGIEAMEPRILLSADALGLDAGLVDPDFTDQTDWDQDAAAEWARALASYEETTPLVAPSESPETRVEIVFLDAGVENGEQMLADLSANNAHAITQVHILDADTDGIAQITQILAHHEQAVDAIHILSHGSVGQLQLGNATLSTGSLDDYAGQLNDWGSALTEAGDILIYGCDLAADEQGRALVDAIGVMTGADVAASVDQTGHAALGGDWQLEFSTGHVETDVAFSQYLQQNWQHALDIALGLSTTGNVNGGGAPGLGSWDNGEMIGLGDPDLEFAPGTTDGTFSSFANFETLAGENIDVDALHYVTRTITLGTTHQITLMPGDVLFSTNGPETIDSLAVDRDDIMRFRPATAGDYSSGSFSYLFDAPISGTDLKSFTLVEQDTIVGDTILRAGDFLFSQQFGGRNDIYVFNTVDVGQGFRTDGDVRLLIDGSDLSINETTTEEAAIDGLELLEANTTMGDETLAAGELLVSVSAIDGNIGTSKITADQQDVFRLQVVKTTLVTGTSVADAAILLNGTALALDTNGEDIDALTAMSGDVAAVPPNSTLTVTTEADEKDGNTASVADLIANPGGDGKISLREAIEAANATDGLNTIEFDIAGSGPHVINLDSALPNISGTVVIDGTSEPNYANSPVIRLDGTALTDKDAFRLVDGSDGSVIRGLAVTHFSGGDTFDIRSDYNTIVGNYMGLETDGSTSAGNEIGVKLHDGADFNTIGGTDAADRNLISGNSYAGVAIIDDTTSDNRIIGNWIGLDADGDVVPGAAFGVVVWDGPHHNQIGGASTGEGNRIAGANKGVLIDANPLDSLNNPILGNEIFANASMAIDLNHDGVNINDAGDDDSGPNDLLNHPVLRSLNSNGGNLEISFDLDVPDGDYRVEFFENPDGLSPSGHGGGQHYLGAVTISHAGAGVQSFVRMLDGVTATALGSVTATATADLGDGDYGSTSEFSAPIGQLAPTLNGASDLASIDEDQFDSPGTLVADLIVGQVDDPNPSDSVGIAVIAVVDSNGKWQHSINGGADWVDFGSVDSSSALLLAADDRVRFVPDPDWHGTVTDGLTFHAWDQSDGRSHGTTVDIAPSVETVRDEFNDVNYGNNDGSASWAGSWVESGDNNQPNSGQVQITGGVLRIDNQDSFFDGNYEERVYRAVDLAAATSAIFSFDFQLLGVLEPDDRARAQVSSNGGSTWTTLETFYGDGPDSGPRSYDISAYASADTQIRFRISNAFGGTGEFFAVDDVQISYSTEKTGGGTAFSATSASSSITVNPVNDAPTLTVFAGPVDLTDDGIEVEITLDDLKAWGDEADVDGTVDAFVIKSFNITNGTLQIGASAATATDWASGSNDTLNAVNKAYWTPTATGIVDAFTVVAKDNDDAESIGPVQVTVEVVPAGNQAPTVSGTYQLPDTDEDNLSAAVQVSTIIGGLTVTDESPSTLGIAIENVSGLGAWQYSIDGSSWNDLGPVSESAAFLLSDTSWIRYKPDFQSGEDPVVMTVRAWDGTAGIPTTYANPGAGGGSSAFSAGNAQVTLTVNEVDDTPTMTPDTGELTEDLDPVGGDLIVSGTLAAGTGGDVGEDQFFAAVNLTGNGGYGTLDIDAGGNWTYTVSNGHPDIQDSKPEQTLTDVVEVRNFDGITPTTVTITIRGADDIPVITGDTTGSVTEDDAPTLTVIGDLDAIGGDAGEELFNAETLTGTYGDLTVTAEGGWSYGANNSQATIQTLRVGDELTDTFTITNADDETTQTVTITISGANDAPTIVPIDLGSIDEEGSRLITQADLLAGSSDTEGDDLSAINLTLSSGSGTLTDNEDGTWTFDPTLNWNGTAVFGFGVYDGNATTANTASLTVDAVNDAPTISVPGGYGVDEDGGYRLLPALNIADVDASGADLKLTVGVDHGVLLFGTTTGLTSVTGNNSASVELVGDVSELNAALDSLGYRPDLNYSGGDNFAITLDDLSNTGSGGNLTATDGVAITVNPEDDPASFSGDTAGSGNEDGGDITGTLTASDPADGMTDPNFTVVAAASNGTASIDAVSGVWSYTPDPDFNGSDGFTVQVTDDDGNAATLVIGIAVNPTDDPATIGGDISGSGDEDGSAITGALTAIDTADGLTDGTYFMVSADGSNGTATIDPANGAWSYTPDPNFNGSDSFEVTVTDDDDHTATQVISITVNPINDPVTIGGDVSGTGDEDTAISGTLIATDATDGLTDGTYFTVTGAASNGSAIIDPATRQWTYTPAADFNGSDSFEVTITDDDDHTETQLISVTVNPVVDVIDDSLTTDEDTPVSVNVLTGTNGASADSFAGSPVLTGVTQGSNGSVTFDGAGNVTYTPDADFHGSDSFTYTITSGGVNETATVDVTVNPVGDLTALDDSFALDEDAILNGSVATNDSTTSGGTLSYSLDTDVGQGALSLNTDGSFSYTPDGDYHGTDGFTYRVTDSVSSESLVRTATLTINSVDDPMTIGGDLSGLGDEDTAISGTLNAADTADGLTDGTFFTVSADGSNGTATIDPATGLWAYTPTANFHGSDSFEVTITDDDGFVETQVIGVTVNTVDDPVSIGGDISGTGDEDTTISGTLVAADAADGLTDGTYFTVSTDGSSGSATIDPATGLWTYTPTADFHGSDSFEVTITDDDGYSETQVISLTVVSVNDPPSVVAINLGHLIEDNSRLITQGDLLAGSSDTEDDPLSAANLALSSASGALTDNGDGTWTFDPAGGWSGAVGFRFDVDDGTDTTTNTASLTVDPVNDAPIVVNPIPDQSATEETPFVFQFAAGTFDDADAGDSLSYAAGQGDGSSLPSWLTFDPSTHTFSGTPDDADVGSLIIRVTATDSIGASVSDSFRLVVSPVNDAPTFGNNRMTLDPGDTVVMTPAMLSASDVDHASNGLQFTVSGVVGGRFELTSAPGVAVSGFTQAQLADGDVVFVDDGDNILPAYQVSVSDGTDVIGPVSASVSFNPAVVVTESPAVPLVETDPVVSEPVAAPEPKPEPEEEADNDEPVAEDDLEVEEDVVQPIAEEDVNAKPDDTVTVVFKARLPTVSASVGPNGHAVQGLLKALFVKPVEFAAVAPALASEGFAVDQTTAAIRAVLQSDDFNERIDQMREDIQEATVFTETVVGSSVAVTTGLSVGYVAWLVRGGVLLSTALSSLPAWQFIDPLPVLARTKEGKGGDGPDDSLQTIIKEQSQRADRKIEESRRQAEKRDAAPSESLSE